MKQSPQAFLATILPHVRSKHTQASSASRHMGVEETRLSKSCSRAEMKKWTACAFSSTRKDRRPKKWTMPPMACNMACQAVGGAGGGFAASNGAPVTALIRHAKCTAS